MAVTGQSGIIKLGANSDIVAEVRSFTIDQSQDTVETTSMEATGNSSVSVSRTYKPGLSTFTISADLYFDGDNAQQATLEGGLDDEATASPILFKLYPAGVGAGDGKAFSGNAIMTSFSVSTSVDGAVEASIAAQGTGALTMDDADSIT